MGAVDSKKKTAPPPLPAPTETDSTSPTDVATDLERPIENRSSYSLPDDGTPVTIKTRQTHNRSQTSLLIEYFEGGKGPAGSVNLGDRKPSVRVRLTPSRNRKNDHIQITETKSGRKASLTRKASASAPATPVAGPSSFDDEVLSALDADDLHSMNSYVSATEESNVSHNPIDIEIDRRRRRPASPLIPTTEGSKASYQPGNMSEISAIPTDSFLDGSGPSSKSPERRRDKSPSRVGPVLAAAAAAGMAGAAASDKVRSSRSEKERVVLPKTRDRDRERSERKHKSKSRASSVSEKHREDEKSSSRRKSSRSHQESTVSAADSSIVSSALSPSHRSDQQSVRSGASKASSINNPKLLETVEDAIRRLILPELNALKREQSRNHGRRSSITSTSGTSVSREDIGSDRRRSGGSERHGKLREPRDREARNMGLESPAPSVSEESMEEYSRERTPSGNGKLKAAAAGAALGGLTAAAMGHNEAREQRKRRRAEAKSRTVDNHQEENDESDFQPTAPMPLMSEINPSEMTRTSILSADSDLASPDSAEPTPVRTVGASRTVGTSTDEGDKDQPTAPATLAALGTTHINVSHGDLRALPRTGTGGSADNYARRQDEYDDDYDEEEEEDSYQYGGPAGYYYSQLDVPAPLKYEPYSLERHGLSPIPSVSGYTEGGSEVQHNHDSRVTHRTSGSFSPFKSPQRDHMPGTPGSVPSNMRSREFDHDDRSLRSSGYDYRNPTESELESASPGQAVRGIGANPNYVHIPMGVESAVASLIDGSMVDGSVLTDSGRGSGGYGAMRSADDDGYRSQGSHGQRSMDQMLAKGGPMVSPPSPDASNSNTSDFSRDRISHPPSDAFAGEYELDQYGRKVPTSQLSERHSPTVSEAAITGAAVAAASKALRAKERGVKGGNDAYGDAEYAVAPGDMVQRNKSFKERTMDGHQPVNTPSHSVDRLDDYDQPKIGASGVPDANDPIPEIGFYEQESNPSMVEGRLNGSRRSSQDWSGRKTPTQLRPDPDADDNSSIQATPTRETHGFGTAAGVAAGAAAIATAAALASAHSRHASQSHSRQASQDHEDWRRNSDDHKRDTLVTNPFEGNSPHVNIPGLGGNMVAGSAPPVYQNPGFGADFGARSPLHNKVDEGYISQGANKTPDHTRPKGKGVEFSGPINASLDDPFYAPKAERHLSGMSQGLGSPLYDPSTGAGIDRIESKDIIALMQHLMVRDAQRSARDTEILMTLVRSAAEMRESFEKIKHMIADSEDVIIREVEENTEKTVQRHLGGPRPFPGTNTSGARTPVQGTVSIAGTEDLRTKKQNLFRRALKGLSAKGNNDLGRIEDMLMQLLSEVDTLKMQTSGRVGGGGAAFTPIGVGVQSLDNLQPAVQYEQDRGYEPEGHAGTSTASHASHSGHFSIPQQRVGSIKQGYERKFSDHRISTVPEANEEEADHGTPQRRYQLQDRYEHQDEEMQRRGGSVPVSTPPHAAPPAQAASASNENTPQDKSRKHKSSGSSNWFPKISRWSETTTSSMGKVFRSSKDSKKDAGDWSYDGDPHVDPYGDDKLHTGFSQEALPEPEDPKYKAHRDSMNLQHPRPRQQACKVAIETGAEGYGAPRSPNSINWAESATSLHRLQGQGGGSGGGGGGGMRPHQYGDLSGSGHQEYQQPPQFWSSSPVTSGGPPIPPKEPLDSGMTPPKSGRVSKLQKSSPLPFNSVESGYGTAAHGSYNDSPRLENRNLSGALGGAPTRRPSGPRAMTPRSDDERRRKRDTFGSLASQESETF